MTKFEEDFPSFENIRFDCNPCNKQFFSARNNYINVIPERTVKSYLKIHCLDKSKVKEVIDSYAHKTCVHHRDKNYNFGYICGYCMEELKKELGLK